MNMQTAPLNYAVNAFGVQSNGSWQCSKSRTGSWTPAVCSSNSRTSDCIPKLEPFTRNKIDRAVREPPLIQKAENQIAGGFSSLFHNFIGFIANFCAFFSDRYNFNPFLDAKLDYCVTLEGDESYSCWQAYFELKDLEKESPKEEVERLIVEAGGVKSLISCVHGVAGIHKAKKECGELRRSTSTVKAEAYPCPIPDGLPKTPEELEEEEKARMPDSPFTRLLRARGRCAAWYSQPSEHETH
ncbi:CCG-binding protein 1 [Salvia divinorum]|uniref:CCG-binding protein 1 n=1 Tax=Salvia divinorum TaxID=28513 RepID=A0ABD1FS79_SALDI